MYNTIERKIATSQAIAGRNFKDQDIICEALQVSGNGVSRCGLRPVHDGNKPLAGLGDSILKLRIRIECYKQHMSTGKLCIWFWC
jgi:hypothetical protein